MMELRMMIVVKALCDFFYSIFLGLFSSGKRWGFIGPFLFIAVSIKSVVVESNYGWHGRNGK